MHDGLPRSNGTLYFFVEEMQAFIFAEKTAQSYYLDDPSDVRFRAGVVARLLFSQVADLALPVGCHVPSWVSR